MSGFTCPFALGDIVEAVSTGERFHVHVIWAKAEKTMIGVGRAPKEAPDDFYLPLASLRRVAFATGHAPAAEGDRP